LPTVIAKEHQPLPLVALITLVSMITRPRTSYVHPLLPEPSVIPQGMCFTKNDDACLARTGGAQQCHALPQLRDLPQMNFA